MDRVDVVRPSFPRKRRRGRSDVGFFDSPRVATEDAVSKAIVLRKRREYRSRAMQHVERVDVEVIAQWQYRAARRGRGYVEAIRRPRRR